MSSDFIYSCDSLGLYWVQTVVQVLAVGNPIDQAWVWSKDAAHQLHNLIKLYATW